MSNVEVDILETEAPIWEQEQLPGSVAVGLSFCAALINQDSPEPQLLCSCYGQDNGIRLRLSAVLQAGVQSLLDLRFSVHFTVPHIERQQIEVMHLYLHGAQVQKIKVQKVVPTDPLALLAGQGPAATALEHDRLWHVEICRNMSASFHASNIFSGRVFGDQTAAVNILREYLRQSNTLSLFAWGRDLPTIFASSMARFENELRESPLRAWYPTHPDKVFIKPDENPPPKNRPFVKRVTKSSFLSKEEYVTVMGFGNVYEHEYVENQMGVLEHSSTKLWSLTIPNTGDRRYIGFLQFPENFQLNQKSGNLMKINFNPTDPNPADDWHAVVVTTMPFAPPDTTTVLITRPWKKDEKNWYQAEAGKEPRPLSVLEQRSIGKARNALLGARPQDVAVNINASDLPFRRQMSALRRLQELPEDSVKWTVLLGNVYDLLPRVDMFSSVGHDFSSLMESVNFNEAQRLALASLRELPGGFGLIQGPPGTGKTYWSTHIILPLLAFEHSETCKRHKIMMLAPTNEVADDLAAAVERVQSAALPDRHVLVVRVHCMDTEEELAWQPATQARPRPPNARPPIIDGKVSHEVLLHDMMFARFVSKTYERETAQPAGVQDRRARNAELSLGHRMLQVAGIIESPWADRETHNIFRSYFEQWEKGDELDADALKSFCAVTRELRDAVVAKADIICGTLFSASEPTIYSNFQPDAIVIDEAAKALEAEIWPALAFYDPRIFLLVGDHKQLRPLIIARNSPFANQMRISLFTRLHSNGLHDVMLLEQNRMGGRIGQLVSTVFYDNQLTTNPKVFGRDSALLARLHKWSTKVLRMRSEIFFIDVKGSVSARDGGRQRSRINQHHLEVGLRLILELCKNEVVTPSDLVILTPYQAQRQLYLRYLSILSKVEQNSALRLNDVRVKTIDSFLGGEADIVILDLTVTAELGFVKEGHRLNVALSRAKSALFILGNWQGLEYPKGIRHRPKFVQKLTQVIREFRVRVPAPNHWEAVTPTLDEM